MLLDAGFPTLTRFQTCFQTHTGQDTAIVNDLVPTRSGRTALGPPSRAPAAPALSEGFHVTDTLIDYFDNCRKHSPPCQQQQLQYNNREFIHLVTVLHGKSLNGISCHNLAKS